MIDGQGLPGAACAPDAWNDNTLLVKRMIDLMFSEDPEDIDYAKSICAECPVRIECMELGRDEQYGIWGGLSPEDRGFASEEL